VSGGLFHVAGEQLCQSAPAQQSGFVRARQRNRVWAGVSSFPYGLCAASPQVSRGIRLREETPSESGTDPPGRLWLPLAGQTGRRARPVCFLILGGLPSGEDTSFMCCEKTCPRRTGRPPSDEVQELLAPSPSLGLPKGDHMGPGAAGFALGACFRFLRPLNTCDEASPRPTEDEDTQGTPLSR
jgi:hypothetical protein